MLAVAWNVCQLWGAYHEGIYRGDVGAIDVSQQHSVSESHTMIAYRQHEI